MPWLILLALIGLLAWTAWPGISDLTRRRRQWVAVAIVLVVVLLQMRQLKLAALLAAGLALAPRVIRLAAWSAAIAGQLGIDWQAPLRDSLLRTPWLQFQVDPKTGVWKGRVLQGPHAGRDLADLSTAELAQLRQDLGQQDRRGRVLLDAWVWRRSQAAGGASGAATQTNSGKMSREEALAILGLSAGADAEAIRDAHRRLVQRLHPDRGGSDYLAQLLNQARRTLLVDG